MAVHLVFLMRGATEGIEHLMRVLASIFALWGLVLPAFGQSSASPVVVELYTSQGCSSCPPADALLHRLAAQDDVLALALHVDYWDYIGWKDKFARPEHTRRQKGYAHAGGRRMIYTPQMIIMGQQAVAGSDAMEIAAAIGEHQAQARPVELTADRDGDRLSIHLNPKAALGSRKMLVQIVRFQPERSVNITRGELAGRNFTYANVVEDWHVAAEWDGKDELTLSHTLTGPAPAAVLVQEVGYGRILAAARVE